MAMAMLAAFYSIIRQVSADFAGRYATSSAGALSSHIAKEIALMAKTARSNAVVDWLANEDDEAKKILAYDEMSGIIGDLYGNNLYVGFKKSLHEYKVDEDYTTDNIRHYSVLDENNPDDNWFFYCMESFLGCTRMIFLR